MLGNASAEQPPWQPAETIFSEKEVLASIASSTRRDRLLTRLWHRSAMRTRHFRRYVCAPSV